MATNTQSDHSSSPNLQGGSDPQAKTDLTSSTFVSETNPTQGTTEFIQQVVASEYQFPNLSQINDDLVRAQVVTTMQDIREFLKRPIILRQGVFTEASAGIIHAIDLPYDLLHNTMYTPKVQGFLNFRATTVITLQVNASRFCAGRLLLHFLPQAQVAGSMPGNRLLTLTQTTSQPNVQLDLSSQTEVSFKVPFCNPKLYYDLTTGDGPIGAMYMSVYSPLRKGTGSTDPDYTVWGHFEDVELEIPVVPTTFLTQSGFTTSSQSRKKGSDGELGAKQSIASLSNSVTRVISTVQGLSIPLLSSIISKPSWALGVVAKTLGSIGFSNPTNESMPTLYRQNILSYMSHSDRGNNYDKLSYFSSNKVETMSGLGATDLDEASFGYIASKSAVFVGFNMDTTQAYGTVLYTLDISESSFASPETLINDGTSWWYYKTYTPVGLLMHYFKYWRGSLVLKFKIVKTEFHTGRIAVTFNPNPNSAQYTPTIDQTNYLLRTVVDLTDATEFELTIPYTNNSPWMEAGEIMGRLNIYVINKLQCPPTVSSTINFIIEVAGGEDFEIAGPAPINTPHRLTPLVVSNLEFSSQSGFVPDKISATIGNSDIPKGNLAATRYCIGEKLTSVYQIIKRAQKYHAYLTPNFTSFWIRPFTIAAMGRGRSSNDFSIGTITSDPLSLFASAYAYSRGSAGAKISDNSVTQTYKIEIVEDDRTILPYFMQNVAPTSTEFYHGCFTANKSPEYGGGCEVMLPHYAELPCRLNRLNCTLSTDASYSPPLDAYDSNYAIRVSTSTSVGTSGVYTRIAGDDYQLAMFIGFPPLYERVGAPI